MTAATMDRARYMASELIRMESRGSGDLENAMRRLGSQRVVLGMFLPELWWGF